MSFKANRQRDKNVHHKDWGHSLRAHLEEDDVDMGNTANSYNNYGKNKFFKKKGKRSGSPLPHHIKRKLPISSWYRITVSVFCL